MARAQYKNITKIALAFILLCFFLLKQVYDNVTEPSTDYMRENANMPFDYYMAALSWSPTYCLTEGKERNSAQCNGNQNYGFILHGLWPQYKNGWPDHCSTNYSPPSKYEIDSMLDITPSRGLIRHQWKKHGSCTGLSPKQYFDAAHNALSRINIPTEYWKVTQTHKQSPYEIEKAFLRQNDGFNPDGITVICAQGRLREIRVCFDHQLNPMDCMGAARQDCRTSQIKVPKM